MTSKDKINETVQDVYSDEGREFLIKVQKENPDLYDKFKRLVANRGIGVAKDKYREYDPEVIKQKKRTLSRQEKWEKKAKIEKFFKDFYGDELLNLSFAYPKIAVREVGQLLAQVPIIKKFPNVYTENLSRKKVKNATNFHEFLKWKGGDIPLLKITLADFKKRSGGKTQNDKDWGKEMWEEFTNKVEITVYVRYPQGSYKNIESLDGDKVKPEGFRYSIRFFVPAKYNDAIMSKFSGEEMAIVKAIEKLNKFYVDKMELAKSLVRFNHLMQLTPAAVNPKLNEQNTNIMEDKIRKIIRESIDNYLNEFDLHRKSGLLQTKEGTVYYEYHCDAEVCKLDLYDNSKEGKEAPDESMVIEPEKEQKLMNILNRLDIRNMTKKGSDALRTPFQDKGDIKTALALNIVENIKKELE